MNNNFQKLFKKLDIKQINTSIFKKFKIIFKDQKKIVLFCKNYAIIFHF